MIKINIYISIKKIIFIFSIGGISIFTLKLCLFYFFSIFLHKISRMDILQISQTDIHTEMTKQILMILMQKSHSFYVFNAKKLS